MAAILVIFTMFLFFESLFFLFFFFFLFKIDMVLEVKQSSGVWPGSFTVNVKFTSKDLTNRRNDGEGANKERHLSKSGSRSTIPSLE